MSINYFLRNAARNTQKRTFARRQLSQNLLFFVLLSTSFPIILITIVCCQSIVFSEKKPEVLKSEVSLEDSEHNNCCFFLLSTSFPIDLWKIAEKMWCSKKKWHFWVFTATERRSFWCFWRNVTKSDLWVFQRRSSIINVCVDRRSSMFVDHDHDLIDRQS